MGIVEVVGGPCVADEVLEAYAAEIEHGLLPALKVESIDARDPLVVHQVPEGWTVLGAGNYAVAVVRDDMPDLVVKVYAPDKPGIEEEVRVYELLGRHPSYSECVYAGAQYLVLRRLHGPTLYECLERGIPIPRRVVHDVDEAMEYARARGLRPQDIHAKNVILSEGRGMIVDVSDFLKPGAQKKWRDSKRAYFWIYRPVFLTLGLRMPHRLLNGVRKGYRMYRRLRR